MKNVLVVGTVGNSVINDFNLPEYYNFRYYRNLKEIPDEALAECEIFIGILTEEYFRKMPKLEWLQLLSAGANSASWLPGHVLLSNAYGAYAVAISEYMAAYTMAVLQLAPDYLEQQKRHVWEKIAESRLISDCKVLSVGMGSIGSAYLEKMHSFGAECYGVRRTVHDKPDYLAGLYTPDTMDEILGECDVVALSLPHTPQTAGLFNEERMRKMKRGSVLLNVGRGTAIVTDDLLKLTEENMFRGVVLDVTDPEPLPADHPLWNAKNVYITPHVAGRYNSVNNFKRVYAVVRKNLIRYAEGEPPVHIVDRSAGY